MKSVWQNLHSILKDKNPALIGRRSWSFPGSGAGHFWFLENFVLSWDLTAGGYYLGNWLFSNPDDFRNLLDKILPPGKFR